MMDHYPAEIDKFKDDLDEWTSELDKLIDDWTDEIDELMDE